MNTPKLFLAAMTALVLALPLLTNAQQEFPEEPVRYSDTTWYDRGFDLFIGGGMFVGNKFNANYYNGSNLNENNLDFIFQNEYWRRDVMRLINETYPYISINDEVSPVADPNGNYDWETQYKYRTLISLGARYKFSKGWGISLSYSFSRLTATSRCLLHANTVLGNNDPLPQMLMMGKEDRSMIDLSASYLISGLHRVVKPFVELGVQFNYAKVKSFTASLLDKEGRPVGKEFSLLNYYDNQGYYPDAQTYDVIFGGPGFGFSGAAGLKIVCSKSVSVDPTFYCYAGRLGIYQLKNTPNNNVLADNSFTFNWGVLVRVVMNDFFFSKR